MARQKGVLYTRYSRLGGRQAEDLRTLDAQEERGQVVADDHGVQVIAKLSDHAKSGKTLNGRAGLAEALSMIEGGEASVLVAARLSRLARSIPDLREIVQRVTDAGGRLVIGDLTVDTKTATGKLVMTMLAAIAEFELDLATEHGLDARTAAIARGVHIGRRDRVLWGYMKPEVVLVEDPVRGPVMREVFKRRAGGATWSELAAYVEAETGDILSQSTLSNMIANRTYLGRVRSGDLVAEDITHPALTDEETFEAAQSAPVGYSYRKHDTLLAGLMTCGSCGRKMTFRLRRGTEAVYCCQRDSSQGPCPAPVDVAMAKADKGVEESFLAWAKLDATGDPRDAEEIAQVQQGHADAVAERDAWLALPVAGVDPKAWQAQTDQRQAAVDEWAAKLATLRSERRLDVMRVNVADVWGGLDTAERRKMIAAAMDRVVVHRSGLRGQAAVRAPFTARADITWKD